MLVRKRASRTVVRLFFVQIKSFTNLNIDCWILDFSTFLYYFLITFCYIVLIISLINV